MKIPKTNNEKPYIEFRIDKKGKIKLSASSVWWGGKNSSFSCSDGTEGNTCYPKHLNAYIEAFKAKKIKDIEKEISALQNQLEKIKSVFDKLEF